MKETREKKIRNKIFTKKDLDGIWAIIQSNIETSRKAGNNISAKIQVRCEDDTRYEEEDNRIFSEGSVIDLKKSEAVSFEYYDYTSGNQITVEIRHGDGLYGNQLIVRGSQPDWVAITFDKFETLLNAVKPRSRFFSSISPFLNLITPVLFGYMAIETYYFYKHGFLGAILEKNFLHDIEALIVFFFIGALPAWLVLDCIGALWPIIEFDFGPEYRRVEQKRRGRLALLFTAYLVPIILALITLFFK
jgi:hypothetical protein